MYQQTLTMSIQRIQFLIAKKAYDTVGHIITILIICITGGIEIVRTRDY